ncbi:MAG: NAD(P)-binding protein, partial [Pseudobdellovibrio sp.]
MHIYDYIIIGSGLTGLTIAQKINQETDNILILEAQDITGGTNRPVTLSQNTLNNGLRYMPATEASEKALAFLQTLIEKQVVAKSNENLIETYEAAGFKRFVGFGEKSPEFYDQLSYYLNQNEYQLASQPYEWVAEFTQKLGDKIQTKSIVTRFGFEGLESEKPKLTHVIVNGTKHLYAHNFIFAGPAKELGLLVPDDVLNVRAKAKLKKSLAWQSVSLDLVHTASVEKANLFLLNGTTDDDLGPCIGRFTGNISQWTSFIDSESAEDTENIGLVLKKMKRQIKRAFPEVADSITKERISVSPPLS